MPRILHVSSVYPPDAVGGAERVAEMLAETQAARGHEVGVAYLSRGTEPMASRAGVSLFPQASRNLFWIDDVFRQPRALRTANKIGQLASGAAARDFGRAMAIFRPDIVHTHSMVELPPMIWAQAHAAGARVVHTLHDYDLICSRASRFRNGHSCEGRSPACALTSKWKARFAGDIDAVAAVSQPVLDEHRRFGLFTDLGERARIIWNAVELGDARAVRRRDGPFTFGFLGRLVPEKGISTLLEACRLLPGDWRLRVAGRAQEGDAAFRAMAAGLPVEFLGHVSQAPFLQSIDVLVVPSVWREPFGLTVVEAFAAGVPVIGSRLGAIADLVGAVGEDWLVPPGDPAALAARMAAAMAAGRGALPTEDAFAGVLDSVSLDRMIGAYDALYADLLRDRRAA